MTYEVELRLTIFLLAWASGFITGIMAGLSIRKRQRGGANEG